MTTRKYGLLGLTLGMALLAACEKTTVTPPPPEPAPTIVLDLVPSAASIFNTAPGNTVQLVAVVTGTTNQAATFTSSNTAIATVSATGLVTAVAPGIAVITAVSAARATARDASTITVRLRDGGTGPAVPTISIKSITQGGTTNPVNTQNVSGQIDVTLNVDIQPGVVVSRVETLVDGTVVCTQSFAATGEIAVDAAMDPVEIVCSINTAAFNATTGAPTFPNGPHTISARVVLPTGSIAATVQTPLIFNNVSFLTATPAFFAPGTTTVQACVTAGTNARSVGGTGSLWCAGDVRVTLMPVNFGVAGDAIARATVSITTSGVAVSGQSGCRPSGTTMTRASDQTIAEEDGGPDAPTNGKNLTGFSNFGVTITDNDGDGNQDFPGCPASTATLTDTDASNGLSVTFSKGNNPDSNTNGVNNIEDVIQIRVTTVTTGGQAGPVCINPEPRLNPAEACGLAGVGSPPNVAFFANPMRLDNLAPRVTNFDLTPTVCAGSTNPPTLVSNCFVSGAFTFVARTGFFAAVDYGVDSQNAATTFSAGASTSSLVAVTSGAALAETLSPTDLFLQAQVRDGLGNVRNVFPTSDATIVTTDAAAALKFGIDKTAPVIDQAATDASSPPNNGANDGTSYNITYRDDPGPNANASGFGPTPVVAKVERITPTELKCLDPETGAPFSATGAGCGNNDGAIGDGFDTVAGGSFNIGGTTTPAYYRVTYFVRDAAGNTTAQVVRLTLLDTTAPVAGGVSGPSILTGNASATFTSQVTDNLDLGDATPIISYNGVAHLQAGAPASVGAYGPDAFTTSATASATVANFVRSIQTAPGSAITRADAVTFQVRDAAGVVDNDPCPLLSLGNASTANCVQTRNDISASVTAGITASNPETSFAAAGIATFSAAVNNATVCNGTTQAGGPATQPCPVNTATSTTATITSTLPTGATNPFQRVNLYYVAPGGASGTHKAVLIGSAFGASVSDVGGTRTLTWSITWTPAGLAAGGYTLYAVGVDAKGQGLKSNDVAVTVTID